ncbi:MAG: DUF3327 domain-containing protein, partial [Microbacterium sp.]|uniref:enterochelin esterase domain-containing protein n=1 Tax=Microbacterium sp. TaxID=51671 RepID=UPI0039E50C21
MSARTPPKVPRPAPAPRAASPAIEALEARIAGGEDAASFWSTLASTPLVEEIPDAPDERIVTFLWRDADADAVLLFANRLTDERNLADTLLRRLPGSDVWAVSYRMGAGWRASYSFLVQREGERAPWLTDDDQVALRHALDRGRPDPRNPETVTNRAGVTQSVAALPAAPAQAWLAPRAAVA